MIMQSTAADYRSVIEQQASAIVELMIENVAYRRVIQEMEIAQAVEVNEGVTNANNEES